MPPHTASRDPTTYTHRINKKKKGKKKRRRWLERGEGGGSSLQSVLPRIAPGRADPGLCWESQRRPGSGVGRAGCNSSQRRDTATGDSCREKRRARRCTGKAGFQDSREIDKMQTKKQERFLPALGGSGWGNRRPRGSTVRPQRGSKDQTTRSLYA